LALRVALGIGGAVLVTAPGQQAIAEQKAPRRAWLGVELGTSPAGVIAKHVVTSSPARSAGLMDGDVILEADGVSIDKPTKLIARVASAGPGVAMKLKIKRGTAEREVEATPIENPGEEQILKLDKVGTFAPTWKPIAVVSGAIPANVGQLRGRVVLLDFWASWCRPCRVISKDLSKIHAAYADKGLSIVGLTPDAVDEASEAAKELGMLYPVASDPGDATAALYGVRALPTMFVIDKKGVIRDVIVGYTPGHAEALEKLVTRLLAEPAPS